jgi:DNA topoisomerase I
MNASARPTWRRGPRSLRLAEADQRKLYELIWKRTIASQMAAARLERTAVDVGSAPMAGGLRATGQVVLFDGFLAVYDEGRDDEDEDEGRLPQVMQGEGVDKRPSPPSSISPSPRRAIPRRRWSSGWRSWASGGRPPMPASSATIQDREYVRKDKNRLIPEDKGRLVTAFLTNYFRRYVDYDFTADLESQLDDVSAGERDYKEVLARFWRDFSAAIAETADLRIGEVLERLTNSWPRIFIRPRGWQSIRGPARPAGTGGCI